MSANINVSVVVYCQVAGFPEYKIGNNGELVTLYLPQSRMGVKRVLGANWRPVLTHIDRRGYVRATLTSNGVRRYRYIHQLVLEAFVGQRLPGIETRHLDGNKTNNKLYNLAWGTAKDNANDRDKHGTLVRSIGEKCGAAKLVESEVLEIRRKHAAGATNRYLADEFGVSTATIIAIIYYRTWRHI